MMMTISLSELGTGHDGDRDLAVRDVGEVATVVDDSCDLHGGGGGDGDCAAATRCSNVPFRLFFVTGLFDRALAPMFHLARVLEQLFCGAVVATCVVLAILVISKIASNLAHLAVLVILPHLPHLLAVSFTLPFRPILTKLAGNLAPPPSPPSPPPPPPPPSGASGARLCWQTCSNNCYCSKFPAHCYVLSSSRWSCHFVGHILVDSTMVVCPIHSSCAQRCPIPAAVFGKCGIMTPQLYRCD